MSLEAGVVERDFLTRIPEDLRVYMSQDTKDPGPANFEKCLTQSEIVKLNNDGRNYFRFGNAITRSEKKYPNTIYISFFSKENLYTLFVKYKLQKSEDEKQFEMSEKVKKFKEDMASKKRVNIDWKALSPRTIKYLLLEINEELD